MLIFKKFMHARIYAVVVLLLNVIYFFIRSENICIKITKCYLESIKYSEGRLNKF